MVNWAGGGNVGACQNSFSAGGNSSGADEKSSVTGGAPGQSWTVTQCKETEPYRTGWQPVGCPHQQQAQQEMEKTGQPTQGVVEADWVQVRRPWQVHELRVVEISCQEAGTACRNEELGLLM